MNALARRLRQTECDGVEMSLAGARIVCDPSGVLYAPGERLLIVSDLHLEKGAAFARRGMMLPPYDTAATLEKLAEVIDAFQPSRVVALGDSFHDADPSCPGRRSAEFRLLLVFPTKDGDDAAVRSRL